MRRLDVPSLLTEELSRGPCSFQFPRKRERIPWRVSVVKIVRARRSRGVFEDGRIAAFFVANARRKRSRVAQRLSKRPRYETFNYPPGGGGIAVIFNDDDDDYDDDDEISESSRKRDNSRGRYTCAIHFRRAAAGLPIRNHLRERLPFTDAKQRTRPEGASEEPTTGPVINFLSPRDSLVLALPLLPR